MSESSYSLTGYGHMIADQVRMGAFSEALRRAIRPGSVVVDIGTGPGIMAVLACQKGAKRVYAIEPDPIIQVGREVAAANYCADKIEFIEDFSTNVTLPEPADVIVSDMRGILPLFARHIPSIADARNRLLAPGGCLIGREDRIWAAVVEAPEQYEKIVGPWERGLPGQVLGRPREMVVNDVHKSRFSPEQLLTEPLLWTALDYTTIEDPDVSAELNWSSKRNGTAHGIVVWFDATLLDDIGFSNAPGTPEAIYGSLFFPWTRPVPLAARQGVRVQLTAKLLEREYTWRWTTHISAAESSSQETTFDQSQLKGAVISLSRLHRSASDYVPRLSEAGRLQHRALELMNGTASLEQIARQLTAEFPERFEQWHRALRYAGPLAQELSR